jgi:hypothetical protein
VEARVASGIDHSSNTRVHMNDMYNLALTRQRVNIVQSVFDLKEHIRYFSLQHIMYRVFRP